MLPIAGCVNNQVGYIQITPTTQALTVGQTVQFTANGIIGHGSHPTTSQDVTTQVTWTSSTPAVATVSSSGLATALSAGTSTITASMAGSSSATAMLTVTGNSSSSGEPLASLAIVPSSQTATAVNQTAQFIAIGTTASGTTVNLTNQPATINGVTIKAASWNSSVAAVATINPATGLATAVASGTTTITAVATNPDGTVVAGTATYTVTTTGSPEPLVSLAIVPASQTLTTANQTAGLIAIGTTASGTTVNLTGVPATIGSATINAAVWNSSVPSVAKINSATGVATAVANGTAAITAMATNPDGSVVTGTATITVNIPTTTEPLVSLAIVPASQTLTATNQTAGFIAIGTTASGTTVNLTNMPATIGSATINAAVWNSSVPSVAKINSASGVATAVANGTTAITAVAVNPDGTVVTGTATLTVNIPTTPEPIVSLAIVPASQTLTATNQSAGLIAIGTTASGTTVNLTGVPAIIGSATINAAVWNSSVPSVAKINSASGIATAVANGITAITAIASNPDGTVVTGTATLTVNIPITPGPLLSLAIVPASQSVAAAGQTTQFMAIGDFSSSSSTPGNQNMANVSGYSVKWGSSNTQVATIDPNTGIATGVGQGATAITVVVTNNTDKTGATATATFTVTGPSTSTISALSIIPGSQAVTLPTIGSTLQTIGFVAIGTNSSTGLAVNVTSQVVWSSSNSLVATIDSAGIATALSQGQTTITAIATNPDLSVVPATATLTVAGVASEPLLSLAIIPGFESVAYPGQKGQFTAIGTFSTAPATQNLTTTATWSSSNTKVATVGASSGLVTAVGQGTAVILAIASNPDTSVVTATATFTVVNAASEPVASLAVLPASQTVEMNQSGQFIAMGTDGTTGLQSDVTTATNLTWSSSNTKVATVGLHTGLAAAQGPGTATIIAEYTNSATSVVTATATITVPAATSAPEPLLSIAILPASQTVESLNETGQFIAIGTFSTTPTVRDLTSTVTWSSSDTKLATINGSGLATALFLVQGSTAIIATDTTSNPDGTAVTGTASFSVIPVAGPIGTGLATLTVENAGRNTTTWSVTAPSATGVVDTIHCDSTGTSVCVATYPIGTTVTLTATPGASGTFNGWSSNCAPVGTVSPNGPDKCIVSLANNDTVAAIIN